MSLDLTNIKNNLLNLNIGNILNLYLDLANSFYTLSTHLMLFHVWICHKWY